MVERIGSSYLTSNIEAGEYSYVVEAGSKAKLEQCLGREVKHFKLDIRFEDEDFVVLVETKQNFVEADIEQLKEYLEEERVLHPDKKIICILANTKNDKIKVWKTFIDNSHFLPDETVLDTMEHYKSLFYLNKQNDRERVLKNTYGRKWKKTLPTTVIKLPIQRDSNGNPVIDDNRTYSDNGYIPDWQFMEDYINSLPYSDRI